MGSLKEKRDRILRSLGVMGVAKALLKKCAVVREYQTVNKTGFFASITKVNQFSKNYYSLFDKVVIRNCGCGEFYYTLDDSVRIFSPKELPGNIPVDFSFVLNHDFGSNETIKAISHLVDRIDDPRISLRRPENLKEALQSILFWHSLLWQTGHRLVGLGRLDKVLASYPVCDNSRDLIRDFLLTLHQKYEFKSSAMKGDTGQIILLGGLEEDGSYYCNEYTYLFIDCLKEIQLPDPKILLRVSKAMPEKLLLEAVDCISTGIGSPLISNDDVIIPLMQDFGYEKHDAYNYGTSACWEPLSIGNSLEQNNITHLEFGKCINETILDSEFISSKSFQDVMELYYKKLHVDISKKIEYIDEIEWEKDPLLSMMMGLETDISEGGAKYNNYGILTVGMSAAVNSLLNIQHFVFETKTYTLQRIQEIIADDYKEGVFPFNENEQGYGTDSSNAIALTNQIIRRTEEELKDYRNRFGGKVKFGLSSSAYITFSKDVGATLDGRKKNMPFPTHISRDKGEPLTEIMNFESKLQYSGISANANLIDIIVQKELIKNNMDKFVNLLMGGIRAGIFQVQYNVLSYAQLVDAKRHPEKYPTLIVRIWGFSAYFNELPEEYKDNLIRRAKEAESIA